MARYYAVKYGPQGIRVNVVSPCTFVKPESANHFANQSELRRALPKNHPPREDGDRKGSREGRCVPLQSGRVVHHGPRSRCRWRAFADAAGHARARGCGHPAVREEVSDDDGTATVPRPQPQHSTRPAHCLLVASHDLLLALPLARSAIGNDYLHDQTPQPDYSLNLHLCVSAATSKSKMS